MELKVVKYDVLCVAKCTNRKHTLCSYNINGIAS